MLGDVGINMQQMQDVNLDINPVALNGNAAEDQGLEVDDQMDIEAMED